MVCRRAGFDSSAGAPLIRGSRRSSSRANTVRAKAVKTRTFSLRRCTARYTRCTGGASHALPVQQSWHKGAAREVLLNRDVDRAHDPAAVQRIRDEPALIVAHRARIDFDNRPRARLSRTSIASEPPLPAIDSKDSRGAQDLAALMECRAAPSTEAPHRQSSWSAQDGLRQGRRHLTSRARPTRRGRAALNRYRGKPGAAGQ